MIEALKFLIVGPLISIYRALIEIQETQKRIEINQMASYEDLANQLTSLGGQVDSIKTELGSDIQRLLDAIQAADQVPAPVVDAANALAAKIDSLKTLDVPNPEAETPGETPATPDVPEDQPAEGDSDQFA